jgi:hypothetical protein
VGSLGAERPVQATAGKVPESEIVVVKMKERDTRNASLCSAEGDRA